jgi:hypothetical protein
MPLRREKVAAYHRARRARIRAEKEVIERAGGRPVFTTRAPSEFGYRDGTKPKPTTPASAPRFPVPALAPAPPPTPVAPRPSMIAIGGCAGPGLVPQGPGYAAPPHIAAASAFTKWQANTETMLAALAERADAQDRRIATLEAREAERAANWTRITQAIVGLFSAIARPG